MGLEHVFDAVIAGDMLATHKPEPDMLLQTIRDLGGGATLYIGDSEIDAETARRARTPFALYAGGYRKRPVEDIQHDWVFDHFNSLGDIVAEAERLAQARL
jgi:phosphoglycolate phosphatase